MSDDRNRSHDEKRNPNDLGFDEMDAERQRQSNRRDQYSNNNPKSKPNYGTDEGRNPRNSGGSDHIDHDHSDHHQVGDDYSDHDHSSHHDDDMLDNPSASRGFGAEETRDSQTSGGNMPENTGASHNTSTDDPRDRSRHRDDDRSHNQQRDRNYDSGDPRDVNRQGDRSRGGHYGGNQRDYSDESRDSGQSRENYNTQDRSQRPRRDDDM